MMSAPLFSITVSCPVLFLGNFKLFQSFCNLFLLFLHEETFHGVILVVLPQQFGQLFLSLDPGSSGFFFTLTVFAAPPPLPPVVSLAIGLIPTIVHRILLHTLTLDLSLLQLIPTVIHTKHSAQDSRTTQIIHSQIAAPLVLVLQKGKAPALAGFLVACEIQVHWIAVLREDSQHITFAELEWQSTNVNVGCVAVVGMPGGVGRDAFLKLQVV